jgi:hypothetical protein
MPERRWRGLLYSRPLLVDLMEIWRIFSWILARRRINSEYPCRPRMENPLMTIENFNRQFQVGEKEREAVEWGWNQEMGNTMFHVVNAYPRAAQLEGLPAEPSYRLQKVGGMVLGMIE